MKYLKLFEDFVSTHDTNKLADIIKMDYSDFVKKLGDDAKDPKLIAAVKAGRKDGSKDDEKIEFHAPGFSNVIDLIPTQNEIDVNGSLHYPLSNPTSDGKNPDGMKKILRGEGVTIKAPVVILNGKYIIDGHHRWSQVYAMNDKGKIETINMQTEDKENPIRMLKAVQMAIAASVGSVPTAVVKGQNLLKIAEKDCKDYVTEKIGEDTLRLLKEIKNIDGKEAAANYIWENVKSMQKSNQPIPNAPNRSVMPQTDADKTEKWQDFLKKGSVNFLPKYKAKNQETHKQNEF